MTEEEITREIEMREASITLTSAVRRTLIFLNKITFGFPQAEEDEEDEEDREEAWELALDLMVGTSMLIEAMTGEKIDIPQKLREETSADRE
jgi:hypothetical protein